MNKSLSKTDQQFIARRNFLKNLVNTVYKAPQDLTPAQVAEVIEQVAKVHKQIYQIN